MVYSDELARAGGDAGAMHVAEFKRRSVRFIRGCLEQALAQRLLREGLKPKELSVIVLGSIMALSLLPERRNSEAPKTAAPEHVRATLDRLIRRDSRAAPE